MHSRHAHDVNRCLKAVFRWLCFSVCLVSLGLAVHVSGVQAGTIFSIPASSCAAINPNQARRLEWRKEGVISRDASQTLWVMCPLIRESGSSGEGALEYFSVAVRVFNDTNTSPGAGVRCILREWYEDTEIAKFDEAVDLFSGKDHVFRWTALRPTDASISIYNVACGLDRDTGVSALHTESSTTASSSLEAALGAP